MRVPVTIALVAALALSFSLAATGQAQRERPAAQGMVAAAVKRLHGKAPLRYVATIRERRRTGEAN